MLPLEAIVCPHCGKVQSEDLYDLTDGEEMEGEFSHICDKCEKEFTVIFKYTPWVRTQ